jgi:hypothetical protein
MGRQNLEYLGVDSRLILKPLLKEIRCEGVDLTRLIQNMVQWWALVITVMNNRVP